MGFGNTRLIILVVVMDSILTWLRSGSVVDALWSGLIPLVIAGIFAIIGRWARWGPGWSLWASRRAFQIVRAQVRNLSPGRSELCFEVLPRSKAVNLESFDIRFMRCKSLWRWTHPVSSEDIHVVDLEWNTRHAEHARIAFFKAPDHEAGSFVGRFPGGDLELKTDGGLDLKLTVEATRPWSGFLSFAGSVPGWPTRAYGRVPASVGRFRRRIVVWEGIKNQVRRLWTRARRTPKLSRIPSRESLPIQLAPIPKDVASGLQVYATGARSEPPEGDIAEVLFVTVRNDGEKAAMGVEVTVTAEHEGESVSFKKPRKINLPPGQTADVVLKAGITLSDSLRVSGVVSLDGKEMPYCYRYTEWEDGIRPRDVPPFRPCDDEDYRSFSVSVGSGLIFSDGADAKMAYRGHDGEVISEDGGTGTKGPCAELEEYLREISEATHSANPDSQMPIETPAGKKLRPLILRDSPEEAAGIIHARPPEPRSDGGVWPERQTQGIRIQRWIKKWMEGRDC